MLTFLGWLGLYGGLSYLALARHPVFGLLCYMAAFYIHPPSRWWGGYLPGMRWSLLAALITLLAVMVHKKMLPKKDPFFSNFPFVILLVLTIYMVIQSQWALLPSTHSQIVVLYIKYMILLYLIYHIIDTVEFLKIFMWGIVAGGFVLGWIAYSNYTGGRFEGFGGAGIGEANVGGLILVFSGLAAGSLFLTGNWIEKLTATAAGVFIVNGIVTTQSRSAFLALAVGSLAFYVLAPKTYRKMLQVLAVVGLMGFLSLTNEYFWERMGTISKVGKVQEDTGEKFQNSRFALMEAQWKMFQLNVMGNGHRGTAALSAYYLDDKYLTTSRSGVRARSSHSTSFTVLVEHGIPGVILWLLLFFWVAYATTYTWRVFRDAGGLIAVMPAFIGASFAAIYIGDQFVDYLKVEIRIWLIALLVILLQWARNYAPGTNLAAQESSRGSRFVKKKGTGPPVPKPVGVGPVPQPVAPRRRFVKRPG